MKRIVDYAQLFMRDYLKDGDVAVDFTMGNGDDTVFLAKRTPHGKVYAFDILMQALMNTKAKLEKEEIDNVELILDGHEHVDRYISSFKVGVFNFGYLPRGNKAMTTLLKTSREAVEKALKLLERKGLLILVLYPGHEQGALESRYFSSYIQSLDTYCYECFTFKMENKTDCPYIIGIEKKREK